MGPELNPQKVAAGMMAGAMMLGLCSCAKSPSPDPSVSPTVGIEQIVEPTPTVEATPSPDDEVADERPDDLRWGDLTEADWSAYDEGYEFSDQPQGVGEQVIFDKYPDLWEQGVRVLSKSGLTPKVEPDDSPTPAVLVQYINGERAEGTEDIPLRFRGRATDINKLPIDNVYENMVKTLKGESPGGTIGQGGYVVNIKEHIGATRGDVSYTSLSITAYEDQMGNEDVGGGRQRTFDTWKDAWAFIEENGYQPNGNGARELYPGEISSIGVIKELPSGKTEITTLNPETGKFDVIFRG